MSPERAVAKGPERVVPARVVEDRRPTAALVVIGSEVLSGKVEEANAAFVIRRFRELGVRLRRIVVVPDDAGEIGRAVREASESHDHVLTTGGVGPTHDDITIDAIATAFDVDVVEDATLGALVRRWFGDRATEGHLRLARVPRGSVLVGDETPPWPTVRFRNVTILPGIPKLMQLKFDAIAERFRGGPVWGGAVHVTAFEADLLPDLDRIVAAHPSVEIGSYPRKEDGVWRVRLTVDSVDRDLAEAALAELASTFAALVLQVEPLAATGTSGGGAAH